IPNRYTATSTILPPQQSSSLSATLISQMGSLGPLGSLAGSSLGLGPMKNPNDLAIALLKSRTVEDAMVVRFDMRMLYHKSRISDARKEFEKRCDIENDTKNGLVRISITDGSAPRAAEMTNAYVDEYKKFAANLAVTEASQRRLFFEQQLEQGKKKLGGAEEALKKEGQKSGIIQMEKQGGGVDKTVSAPRDAIAAQKRQRRGKS